MKTITALDAIGKLEQFKDVFNINLYKNNPRIYYKYLVRTYFDHHDTMVDTTYKILKKKIPLSIFVEVFIEKYIFEKHRKKDHKVYTLLGKIKIKFKNK